jgi:hypothetical protein
VDSTAPADPNPAAPDWPLRAWCLALLGAMAGLEIYWIARPDRFLPNDTHADLRFAAVAFVAVGSVLFGLIVERVRIGWSVAFAAAAAALVAFTAYWNGPFAGSDQPWRIACATLAAGIATPLFQAWREARLAGTGAGPYPWALPYREAYRHAWTDLVLWVAACAFVGVVWAMALLLGELFKLIGIRVLAEVLGKEWMVLTLTGAALGAGIGLLRDRDSILALLQRVVTTILAVLAPVLAVGLVVFLAAIPFTGLGPLWGATRSTSPILLGCIVGALGLANAVIGEDAAQESRNPLLRASVAALGLAMLPLALIAALSTGLRIHQYGLTPDRLWAVVFTAMACAYGLAYLVTLAHRRLGAAPYLRAANLRLSVTVAGLALVLATPLVNFGALSTRDHVARLESGRTPLAEFDWAALRFDFGRSGEAAVRRLAAQGRTPQIRMAAARALKQHSRYSLALDTPLRRPDPIDPADLVVLPRGTRLPKDLMDRLTAYNGCHRDAACVVYHQPGSTEAVIVTQNQATPWRRDDAGWSAVDAFVPRDRARTDRINHGLETGKVELRTVPRRQIFVDGLPVGEDFE